MSKRNDYRLFPNIKNAEDLGVAYLGSAHTSIVVTPKHLRVDRAKYGRKLAALEGGIFTPAGYLVPKKWEENAYGT
ncbi:hypothetical protein FACS1894208_12600 [Clostridia bacterium]|nr:hypothetical protein FACS1894208_12600 [Clostridia bacterium]